MRKKLRQYFIKLNSGCIKEIRKLGKHRIRMLSLGQSRNQNICVAEFLAKSALESEACQTQHQPFEFRVHRFWPIWRL